MRCIVKKGNRELIGSKGLGLYKCQLLDVKVPEFYVIPTKYCMQFKGKKIGKPLANELKQVLKKLGGFVAVRSSSVVEDLETGSMAGQFKTVLNVDTYSGLLKAVRQVWASADGVAPNMAVIIQKQLKPDLAGVLFTRNPVNGKSETVIEYIPGLGDQLVSGKREPNRLVVKKGKDNIGLKKKHNKMWQPLIRISNKLEERFGYPIDIEWGLCDGIFYILQARPITKLPPPNCNSGTTYSRVQAEQFFSGPVSPLFYNIFKKLYAKYYIQETIDALGIDIKLDDDVIVRHKNYLYVDTSFYEFSLSILSNNGDRQDVLEIFPEDIRKELLIKNNRVNPVDLLKIIKYITFNPKYWISNLDKYFQTEVVPVIISNLDGLNGFNTKSNSDLIEAYDQLLATAIIHIRTSKVGLGLYCVPVIRAMEHFLKNNGIDRKYLPTLMSGLKLNKTLDASLEIKALARAVRGDCENNVIDIFELDLKEYPAYKKELERTLEGERVIDHFEVILKKYGHRRLSRDILAPSWDDEPMIPFSILRRLVNDKKADLTNSKQQAIIGRRSVEQKIRQTLPRRKRWKFDILSKYLVRYVAFRELQRFYLDMILSKLRTLVMEVANRMVKSKLIRKTEDIFFLELQEVLGYLEGEHDSDLITKSEFNKLSFEQTSCTPGRYLRSGVDFDSISSSKVERTEGNSNSNVLTGQPISPGYFSGKVRIIDYIDKDVNIERNDIVVTKSIDPGQTHIFLLAGALVLEVGGSLSHGAILAREFNLPTVAQISNATRILKDGQELAVNGTTGELFINERGVG